jgi:hypothetical protein
MAICQRRSTYRNKRHHEGVNADFDKTLRGLEQTLNTIAKTGEQIRAYLAAAEYRDGGCECLQVEGYRDFGFARHDPATYLLVPGLEMHTERIDTG